MSDPSPNKPTKAQVFWARTSSTLVLWGIFIGALITGSRPLFFVLIAGLGMLAVTVSGVALLVVDVVIATRAALIGGSSVLVVVVGLWAAGPFLAARLADVPRNPPPSEDAEPRD